MPLTQRMQMLVSQLNLEANKFGYSALVESGQRTCQRQIEIYRARGEEPVLCSYHLTGDAVDIHLQTIPSLGEPPMTPRAIDRETTLSALGERARALGFRWGGDFTPVDLNHFDDGLRVGKPACCGGPGLPSVAVSRTASPESPRSRRSRKKVCGIECRCLCHQKRIKRSRGAGRGQTEPFGHH